jgi:hypothetical protein
MLLLALPLPPLGDVTLVSVLLRSIPALLARASLRLPSIRSKSSLLSDRHTVLSDVATQLAARLSSLSSALQQWRVTVLHNSSKHQ